MQREELDRYLDGLLEISRFRDYCLNGRQLEGRREIRRIVSAATASLAPIDAARRAGADAILVHHGHFRKRVDPCLTGTRRARIALRIVYELNLFAYHLPLDAHAELGSDAQLGMRLGLAETGRCADREIGFRGRRDVPTRLDSFGALRPGAPVRRRSQSGMNPLRESFGCLLFSSFISSC